MHTTHCRRRLQSRLYCSLCGEEIASGQEYWFCNGSCICDGCLPAFARREFFPCRKRRGEEDLP